MLDEGKPIISIQYKDAYEDSLERGDPFREIDWESKPFSEFRILKDEPPKKLRVCNGKPVFRHIYGEPSGGTFIDGFRQLRNNLVHGAKFLKGTQLDLDDRDRKLICAEIAFITFLEKRKLISLQ
jgi:hypothetical protein